ncbi:MAG: pyrroline-5-carboxylate reductase [Tissierellia bacterium]|nr:pyrroline-5-carboxylate reductase [Tissierellia bacterium]
MVEIDKKIGFIGCGNMAGAMIGGLLKSGLVKCEDIIASASSVKTLENVKKLFDIKVVKDNGSVVNSCDIIFLAVKPNIYEAVIREIKDYNLENKIFISIAAGKTLDFLEKGLGKDAKVLRTMPNTPALAGEGITAICPNRNIDIEELELLKQLIGTFGSVEVIDEKLFDAVVAVSGSSPAYVFMFIEAMADSAVLQGMPRQQAYKFAAQAVLGSAKMVLETGQHPGELKDMVCSPGGTTIEAVAMLEERGFRSAVIEAMRVCGEKSKNM